MVWLLVLLIGLVAVVIGLLPYALMLRDYLKRGHTGPGS